MVIFIVFGGVYVNSENVPRALKWLPNVSLIKHCFEALCVNEFRGLDFETRRRPGEVATGEQVRGLAAQHRLELPSPKTIYGCPLSAHQIVQALERVGFGDSTVKGCALGQASCSTVSCLDCAAAPGKKLQQDLKSKPRLPHHARSGSVLLTSLCRPASSCLHTG